MKSLKEKMKKIIGLDQFEIMQLGINHEFLMHLVAFSV